MASDLYEVMDLKALRCFWAVAKYGSFMQACIELDLSEPAVSQRVKQLERYLGIKLYEARGGRVQLTPAGERTMAKAVSLFDEMEDFERTVANEQENVAITLCTHDSVLRYLLPEVVECFSGEHPLAHWRLLARYCRRPPLRLISRLMLDGARPSDAAIERSDWPATTPRDISSRSDSVSARRERLRGGGRIPPARARTP